MGTSDAKRPKTRKVLGLVTGEPAVKTVKIKSRHQRSRHVKHFESRSDFKQIRWLVEDRQKLLDKLRDDQQASIEHTVRVHHRFVAELNKHVVGCNRTKAIVKAIDIVPFYSDVPRKVVSKDF